MFKFSSIDFSVVFFLGVWVGRRGRGVEGGWFLFLGRIFFWKVLGMFLVRMFGAGRVLF